MVKRRSALDAHPLHATQRGGKSPAGGAQVTLSERSSLAILHVTAFPDAQDEAGARLAAAIGVALPAPNHCTGDLRIGIRAIGPGIWQVVGDVGAVPDLDSLRAILSGVAAVVDLSHARTALHVAGPSAARTLAKVCGLDLEATQFPTGSATNTRFGQLGMTLARLDDAPTFELLVFRGYAEFVFGSLVEAAREFGLYIRA